MAPFLGHLIQWPGGDSSQISYSWRNVSKRFPLPVYVYMCIHMFIYIKKDIFIYVCIYCIFPLLGYTVGIYNYNTQISWYDSFYSLYPTQISLALVKEFITSRKCRFQGSKCIHIYINKCTNTYTLICHNNKCTCIYTCNNFKIAGTVTIVYNVCMIKSNK